MNFCAQLCVNVNKTKPLVLLENMFTLDTIKFMKIRMKVNHAQGLLPYPGTN